MTTFNVNNNSASYNNTMSKATRIQKFYYHSDTETIIVFGADGKKRLCRVNNFENRNDARELWKEIKEYFIKGQEVHFIARGNNSANQWFFQVQGA